VILASLSVLDVVVIVVLAVVVIFGGGGYLAVRRRQTVLDQRLRTQIEAADAALADARAQDRGWDRATIEAAARAAVAPREIRDLHLVQVVDRPGTDADQAVLRIVAADGAESTLTLGRREGAWVAV
jgi:hypothetical protein